MARTRDYMDYLDEHVEIAPANSEEEYQAAQVIAGILKDHELETTVEDFETYPASPIVLPMLMCVMFVCLLVSGLTEGIPHYVALGVDAVCIMLALINHFAGMNVLEGFGPSSQSQNVVAVHRAEGDKVVKGARPIVIVAHYDTPRESLFHKQAFARYQAGLRRFGSVFAVIIAVTLVFQFMAFLPGAIRTFMWVVGLMACVPVVLVSIVDIHSHFASCTPGANDNKSSVAALLSIANKVRPMADRVDEFVEAGGESLLRRAGDEPEAAPEPRMVQVVEETKGVRHGAHVLLSLGILPEDCDIVYEEPRVTMVDQEAYERGDYDSIVPAEVFGDLDQSVPAEFEQEPLEPIEVIPTSTIALDGTEQDSTDEFDEAADEVYEQGEHEDEGYDEEDYDEEEYADDEEDETPSSLGIWFKERIAGIREYFSKDRGSDIDIDRGEDLTAVASEAEDGADESDVEFEEFEEDLDAEGTVAEDLDGEGESDEIDAEDTGEPEDQTHDAAEDDVDEAADVPQEADAEVEAEGALAEGEEVEDDLGDLDDVDELDWDDDFEIDEPEDAPEAATDEAVTEDTADEDEAAEEPASEEAADEQEEEYVFEDDEWFEDEVYEEEGENVVEAEEESPSLFGRIKGFFRGLRGEPEADHEEEPELYDEEEYPYPEEFDVAEDEQDAEQADEQAAEAAPTSAEETGEFVEDDLYFDDEIPEEDSYVGDEDESYEEVEEESAIPEEDAFDGLDRPADPNALHLDYEEDLDIVPRDTTGLDTISDSYDLFDGEIDRVSSRSKPQPVDDPSWGVTSYQPPRPAMNIARRAALLDLPDPSEAFVDPLASMGYSEYDMDAFDDDYDMLDSYDEPVMDDQDLPEEPELEEPIFDEPVEEEPEYDDTFEDEYDEMYDEDYEEIYDEDYEEDYDDLDPSADEEDQKSDGGQKSFWGRGGASDWKGGATTRADVRDAEEPIVIDAEDLQDAILELGDEYLVAHDIWFVATGASQTGHAGIQSFIENHRRDIRGAFLVNLDSVGAGSLSVVVREGLNAPRRADRRVLRLVTSIAQDLHVQIENAMMNWCDLESTFTSRSRIRSVTLMGIDDNVMPAYSHTMDDMPENVNPTQVSNVVRIVTELIRRA